MGCTPDCRCLPSYSDSGWFGPDEGLGSTPAMDNLARAMVVGHGCIHRFDYMRPHSGPGRGTHPLPHLQGVLSLGA
ncbi:unnamed protein product [Echinostoma caproni]|uniref:Uncharacterized protein n=1 Tax=Echinostoma caproni TaxID=27848 RepID=A0A3P8GWR1_9TREM|nr:unnamed protein product [Echinostoma caproni]